MKSDGQLGTELGGEKMKLLVRRLDSVKELQDIACSLIDSNTKIKCMILDWAEMGWIPKPAEKSD